MEDGVDVFASVRLWPKEPPPVRDGEVLALGVPEGVAPDGHDIRNAFLDRQVMLGADRDRFIVYLSCRQVIGMLPPTFENVMIGHLVFQ